MACSLESLQQKVEFTLKYSQTWRLSVVPLQGQDTKSFPHMIDLQEYGVTKKWVIITEISKEVENNTIARVNAYAK